MIKQNINIVNSKILFNILNEIKSNLNFDVSNYDNTNDFIKKIDLNEINFENSLIIIESDNKKIIEKKNLEKRYLYILENLPIVITKLIENINVKLIKLKYLDQSNLSIKDYQLDINSRIILKDNKQLKLTEKEIDIILFLNENNNPQKIDKLQSKVWKYSLNLETHTVETHIYRLRKKIREKFDDDEFIFSTENGYTIK